MLTIPTGLPEERGLAHSPGVDRAVSISHPGRAAHPPYFALKAASALTGVRSDTWSGPLMTTVRR